MADLPRPRAPAEAVVPAQPGDRRSLWARVRDRAPDISVQVSFNAHGYIEWYKDPSGVSRGVFRAVCTDPAHQGREPCHKLASADGATGGKGPTGRPLGMLAAWLLRIADDGEERHEHVLHKKFQLRERMAAREKLREEPNSERLFRKERPRRGGTVGDPLEDDEPRGCP